MTNKKYNYCSQILVRLVARFIHEFDKKAQKAKNKYDKRHKRKVRKIKSEIGNKKKRKRRILDNKSNKKQKTKKRRHSYGINVETISLNKLKNCYF